MSLEAEDPQDHRETLDISELILLELRVISYLLGEGQSENADSIREGLRNVN